MKPEISPARCRRGPRSPDDVGSPFFEVSVEGAENLLIAQESGANRVELCADVADGGITPSIGTVRAGLRVAKVPMCVIVRPRGGDFLYSEVEFESMRQDILALRELGVSGVVSGCLAADGRVDVPRTAELVKLAGGMEFTFHRAFDMVRDLDQALETLVAIGVHRVLTSGGCATAIDGLAALKRLGELAGDRITVMPCGSIRTGNVAQVCRQTGLREFHFAAHKSVASTTEGRDTHVSLGIANLGREHMKVVTDPDVVRATVEAGRGAYAA